METTAAGFIPAVWIPAGNRTIRLPPLNDAMECARICDAITLHYQNDAADRARRAAQ